MKDLVFVGASRDDLRDFPELARRRAGFALREVQSGGGAGDFKPMQAVGAGVFEMAKFEEAVYVLHAFEKKTQRTSKRDIEIGQRRYQQVLDERRKGNG